MKINIAYFTSTGNTLWLVKKAKRIFEENNHTVELFEVVKRGDEFFYNCDMIGIFYPVWSSNMPDPFRDVITSHSPDGNGKKIFLIGNCAQFTGDTEIYWKKVLVNKGYNVFYINHVIMPLNINIPGFNFWDIPEGKEKEKILIKAAEKLNKICRSVLNFEERMETISLYEKIGGVVQRNFYWVENIWKKKLTVDLIS